MFNNKHSQQPSRVTAILALPPGRRPNRLGTFIDEHPSPKFRKLTKEQQIKRIKARSNLNVFTSKCHNRIPSEEEN